MAVNSDDRHKFAKEAETYESQRDEVGRLYLDTFKFIKSQYADWYIAISAVCFAVGGIAISVGTDKTVRDSIVHPGLFWWGALLLIANGVFVFLVRKAELNGESSELPQFRQREADLWSMAKIAREHQEGDDSRADEFINIVKRFQGDYKKHNESLKWWQWIKYIAGAIMVDIVFSLLFFPILMLASQLINDVHITYKEYLWLLWASLVGYIIYLVIQVPVAITQKKTKDAADQQIKNEVTK